LFFLYNWHYRLFDYLSWMVDVYIAVRFSNVFIIFNGVILPSVIVDVNSVTVVLSLFCWWDVCFNVSGLDIIAELWPGLSVHWSDLVWPSLGSIISNWFIRWRDGAVIHRWRRPACHQVGCSSCWFQGAAYSLSVGDCSKVVVYILSTAINHCQGSLVAANSAIYVVWVSTTWRRVALTIAISTEFAD